MFKTRLGLRVEAALEAYVGGGEEEGPLPWALWLPLGGGGCVVGACARGDLGLQVRHCLRQCLNVALQFGEFRFELIGGRGGGGWDLGGDAQDELEGGVGVKG